MSPELCPHGRPASYNCESCPGSDYVGSASFSSPMPDPYAEARRVKEPEFIVVKSRRAPKMRPVCPQCRNGNSIPVIGYDIGDVVYCTRCLNAYKLKKRKADSTIMISPRRPAGYPDRYWRRSRWNDMSKHAGPL